jgi:hypothetical protein
MNPVFYETGKNKSKEKTSDRYHKFVFASLFLRFLTDYLEKSAPH